MPDVNELVGVVGVGGTIGLLIGWAVFTWARSRIKVQHERDLQELKLQYETKKHELTMAEQRQSAELAEEAVQTETLHSLNISVTNLTSRISRLTDERDDQRKRADQNWNLLQEALKDLAILKTQGANGTPTGNSDELAKAQAESAKLQVDLNRANEIIKGLQTDIDRANQYLAALTQKSELVSQGE